MPHLRKLPPGLLLALLLGVAILFAGGLWARDARARLLPMGAAFAAPKTPSPADTHAPSHARDPLPGAPLRASGPDAFGYVVSDSNEPNGPSFAYVAASQLVSDLVGDDVTKTVTLPFPVSIYDRAVSNFTINSNGLLYPATSACPTQGCFTNAPLPSTLAPGGTIAPLWDDLVVTSTLGAGVYTDVQGTAPSRSYIVEWRNVQFYRDPSETATFEVIFHENSNQIEFEYAALAGEDGSGLRATVGIQNVAQTIGLMYSYEEAALTPSSAVRYLALVTPGDQRASNGSCAPVTYTGQVINPNSAPTTYQLTVSDSNPAYHSVVTPTNTGPIPAGAALPFTVTVNIPAGTGGGTSNVTTLNVVSADPNYRVSEVVHLTTLPGGEFVPSAATRIGSAGATLTYSTTLFNRTSTAASFALTSGSSWPSRVSPANTGPLPPAGSITVTVNITIPQGAQTGESDTAVITATAQVSQTCTIYGNAAFTAYNGNQISRARLPQPRARHAQTDFPLNGRTYILGGAGSDNSLNLPILEYDARADTWTSRRTLLTGVSNTGAATLGDTIYVPGGFDGSGATALLQFYQPAGDLAGTVPSDPLPAARYGAGVQALGNRMYVVGGSDGVTVTRTLYQFDPARPAGARWVRKADMPTARVFLAVASLDGRLYAIGGLNAAGNDIRTVEVYDPGSDTWSAANPLSVPRGGAAAVGVDTGQPCGGYLYVFGGGYYNPLATTERFDPQTGTWSASTPLSYPRRTLAAGYVTNGHLLLITGGFNGTAVSNVDAVACGGALPTPTATPPGGVPTATPVPTIQPTATVTVTPCAPAFSDVQPSDYFYTPVGYLACHGVISGYAEGTFRPYANMTRGQLSKVVVLAQGWTLQTPAQPHFSDVPASQPFYSYVETAYAHGVISGYADGTFAPSNNVTRGQIAKIVVLAQGWPLLNPATGHFTDVPPGSTFYQPVETAYAHGILSGYADGTFRPFAFATRGQVSKIVYVALGSP